MIVEMKVRPGAKVLAHDRPMAGLAILQRVVMNYIVWCKTVGVKQISRKTVKWDNVLKDGPSKICGRQPLRNLKWKFKFFKGCLPQILLGPLLNILSQMIGLLVVLLLTFSRAKYCVKVSVTLLIQKKTKNKKNTWKKALIHLTSSSLCTNETRRHNT